MPSLEEALCKMTTFYIFFFKETHKVKHMKTTQVDDDNDDDDDDSQHFSSAVYLCNHNQSWHRLLSALRGVFSFQDLGQ